MEFSKIGNSSYDSLCFELSTVIPLRAEGVDACVLNSLNPNGFKEETKRKIASKA